MRTLFIAIGLACFVALVAAGMVTDTRTSSQQHFDADRVACLLNKNCPER
jgi:hypothetical protein